METIAEALRKLGSVEYALSDAPEGCNVYQIEPFCVMLNPKDVERMKRKGNEGTVLAPPQKGAKSND